MNIYDKIEKLYNLYQKGSITEQEYDLKKQKLLNQNLIEIGPKYQVVYAALAFICGGIGVHNYYIGRWKRGLAQTLICILTLGIGAIITNIWAIINIFAIKTDGKNRRLFPSNPAKWTFGILSIPFCLLWWLYIGVAGFAGYTLAMNRYEARELLHFAAVVQISPKSHNTYTEVDCASIFPDARLPWDKMEKCSVYPDGMIKMSGMNKILLGSLMDEGKGRVRQVGPGEVVIPSLRY